jgi:sulfate transport system permease protein
VMLVVSFLMLLLINTLQWYLQRRTRRGAAAPALPIATAATVTTTGTAGGLQ